MHIYPCLQGLVAVVSLGTLVIECKMENSLKKQIFEWTEKAFFQLFLCQDGAY